MIDLDEVISIKEHPELRHALAHMYYAIEALADGKMKEALYELKSIEALIFWEDDEHMSAYIEGEDCGKMHGQEAESRQGKEKLQRQEELQGKEVSNDSAARTPP